MCSFYQPHFFFHHCIFDQELQSQGPSEINFQQHFRAAFHFQCGHHKYHCYFSFSFWGRIKCLYENCVNWWSLMPFSYPQMIFLLLFAEVLLFVKAFFLALSIWLWSGCFVFPVKTCCFSFLTKHHLFLKIYFCNVMLCHVLICNFL